MSTEPVSGYFACAICPPSSPRPASITCANGCGRHVCVDHAHALNESTGEPLVCEVCWESIFQYGHQNLVHPPAVAPDVALARVKSLAKAPQSPSPWGSAYSMRLMSLGLILMLTLILAIIAIFIKYR